VFWGEGDAKLLKADEAPFSRGQALATKWLIRPDGKVAWEYHKAHPVPGIEDKLQVLSDGKLRGLDTPYGRLSSVICFDADFPQLLGQGYQGRQLAAMDHFRTTDYTLVSEVPTKGARTIYSRLGDWFAWTCMAGLLVVTIGTLRQRHTRS
jgi:apolipoprotein N-acyltransferase